MKQYKVEISKLTEQDHYNDGCDPTTTQDHGVIWNFQSSDLQLVWDRIKSQSPISIESLTSAEPFENRLETSQLEDGTGSEASKSQIEAWKQGKLELYHASYSIYLSLVEKTEINASMLKGQTK